MAGTAVSQVETLEALVDQSRIALAAEDWQRALEISTRLVEEFGKDEPLKAIGPQFGGVYYRKGLCEMKLKQWAQAMESFEICYRDFPENPASGSGNIYQKLALLKWGEAAMGAERWEVAANKFRKFLEERDRTRDGFPQGSFHVNFAVCEYRLGRIVEGNENLEIAIRNRRNFPTPDSGMIGGFQELVAAAIKARNEQVLLDFIGKNRGELVLEPYAMCRFSPALMKLAGDALAAGMLHAAVALYQMVPSLDVAIDDTRARLRAMAGADIVEDGVVVFSREKLERDLALLEAGRRDKKSPEILKLSAVAFIHEAKGNLHGAFAAYQQLELYFPQAEKREDHLFNLVRVSSRLGSAGDTRTHGLRFIQDFPKSRFLAEARRILLDSAFRQGDPVSSVDIARPMAEAMKDGTPEHDHCLYVLGSSLYQLGRFAEAREAFEKHVMLYPKSEWAMPVTFYRASSLARLELWDEAGILLDVFLATSPESSIRAFLPDALYERAACHDAVGGMDEALRLVERVIAEFSESQVAARALLLKGSLLERRDQAKEAARFYEMALKAADRDGDKAVIGEALAALILSQASEIGKPAAKLVSLADRFWKDFANGSPWRSKVAVAQMRAFQQAGRGDEALDRLGSVITETASRVRIGEAEELVRCYRIAYLEGRGPEELEEHFREFPGIPAENRPIRALLRREVISAYERALEGMDDDAKRQPAAAKIKSLYQELRNDFLNQDLPNLVLLRLADHLRLNTSTPREALACYDELIARRDPAGRFGALLGRGDLRGRSSAVEEIAMGFDDFNRVFTESKNPGEREYALFRMIELGIAKRDFAKAAAQAGEYLDAEKSNFTTFVPQVRFLLAKCYVEQKLNDDAIAILEELWKGGTISRDVAGPAMVEWLKLVWARDRPGDRQGALDRAMDFLGKTPDFATDDPAAFVEIERLVSVYKTHFAIQPGTATKE